MHSVQYVDRSAMPPGHSWLLVQQGGDVVLFLDDAGVCADVLEEAWAGYRLMIAGPLPRQRVPA